MSFRSRSRRCSGVSVFGLVGFGLVGFAAFQAASAAPPVAAPAASSLPAASASVDARRPHLAFGEQFAEFEAKRVNGFWRCLFGKDGSARRYSSAAQLSAALESSLFADPRTFPGKVESECVPMMLVAAKGATDFTPPSPPEYKAALESYGKALRELGTAFTHWTDNAKQRVESRRREQELSQSGEAWSTTANPAQADPMAWRYDKFLHCAVPNLDKLKDGQALLELLAGKCGATKNELLDTELLARLGKTCLPQTQTSPTQAPSTFQGTFKKFASDYDRIAQAFGFCFRKMNKSAKQGELDALGSAWEQTVTFSNQVGAILKERVGTPERR